MTRWRYLLAWLPLALAVAFGASATEPPRRVKAVLVAGDDSIPVFDDAAEAMAQWLLARGVAPGDIVRFSADRSHVGASGVRLATRAAVLRGIAEMAPQPGQACFVFATSHGAPEQGLVLSASRDTLPPEALERAVEQGCGAAPTVLVLSGCFSGLYAAPPLTRPNHVVLTAARADRSSFGCAAGRAYTVYDACLLSALRQVPARSTVTWHGVNDSVRACIAAEERREHFRPPSDPQATFGAEVGRAVLNAAPAAD